MVPLRFRKSMNFFVLIPILCSSVAASAVTTTPTATPATVAVADTKPDANNAIVITLDRPFTGGSSTTSAYPSYTQSYQQPSYAYGQTGAYPQSAQQPTGQAYTSYGQPQTYGQGYNQYGQQPAYSQTNTYGQTPPSYGQQTITPPSYSQQTTTPPSAYGQQTTPGFFGKFIPEAIRNDPLARELGTAVKNDFKFAIADTIREGLYGPKYRSYPPYYSPYGPYGNALQPRYQPHHHHHHYAYGNSYYNPAASYYY